VNDHSDHAPRPFWLLRWPWALLLLVVAAVYYGSYYRHGINFRDEGGTLTLLGQRVLNGEVPFRDVDLGYNVGWFLPIAALFKVTGVDFVALRIFMFVLSALAAVLGFLTIERAFRHAGHRGLALPLAFVTGLLLIAVPGMTFKNYNPLAAVANTWALIGFIFARGVRESCWRALVGGLILGATWLVRIDLGTFFTLLWVGTLVFRMFGQPGTVGERLAASVLGFLIVAVGVGAMHAPVLWDAHRRDYWPQFTGAYFNQWRKIADQVPGLSSILYAPKPKAAQVAPAKSEAPAPEETAAVAAPAQKKGTWKDETLSRTSWRDVKGANEKDRNEVLGLFLLTYFPLLVMLPLIAWGVIRWFRALITMEDSSGPLAALVLVGGALTMFPQFFLWRPDAPHLSEFGPGYWTGVIGATGLLAAGASRRIFGQILAGLLFLHAGLWTWRMLPDRWCGTIAARENRKTLFEGENGVRVFEQKKTVAWMNDVLRLIRERSGANDHLVAYPYHPSFNVLGNRRTYEKKVYIDDAQAGPQWGKEAIKRIEKNQPAIIIVSDWDINGTEASRFRNWANDVYAHIKQNYELLGTFDEKEKFEFFVRKPIGASPGVPAAPPAPSVPPANPGAAPAPAVPGN
jgi:hypothetical protein